MASIITHTSVEIQDVGTGPDVHVKFSVNTRGALYEVHYVLADLSLSPANVTTLQNILNTIAQRGRTLLSSEVVL